MIGYRAVISLLLLSALVVCVFAAQNASAALTTSKKTTAFTCVEKPGEGDFEDVHCDKTGLNPGKEKFAHVSILGKTSEIETTNCGVTNSTKDCEPAVLKGTVALVKTEIECTTVKNNLAKSSLENSEPIVGQHTLSGIGQTEFSNCNVKKPEKCVVKEPILASITGHAVEGLEGPKAEKNAMGGEVIGSGEKETITEIEFRNKEPSECSLKNKTFKVQGKLIATSGPTTESAQENKESGATAVYTPKFGMESELKFGGAAAELTLITTVRMSGGNPISATTT